jgi:hypothetical protein
LDRDARGDLSFFAGVFVSEWALMPKVEIVPGMSPAARKAFYIAHQQEMLDRQFARRMIALWEAVRDFLHQDAEVSGRVVIKELDRKRLVVARGVKPVRAQWQVPAMVIDATLPAVPMLQAYFPQVEVAEPVEDDQRAASLLRLFT